MATQTSRSAPQKEQRLIRAALDAQNYRSFIAGALVATSKEGAKPNVAALSRKAGFSSRSFIGDVIDGRRRLSSASYPKLVRALSLSNRMKSYFHLLVVREETELNYEGLSTLEIEARLLELRSKLQSQLQNDEIKEKAVDALFKGRDMLDCYAALGSAERGASIEEMSQKTGLQPDLVAMIARHFVSREIATEKEGRFYPGNPFLFFKELGANQGAKTCYLQSVDELRRKANADFNATDRAFYNFVFSINRSRLPELKQKLWDTMQEFAETSEDTDGDAIAKLLLGFHI